jgi:divalent metal cation (Fe/Co/Zn/Cd) transporter
MAMATATEFRRRSRLLLGATIAWNSFEAVVAVASGVSAGSVALVGFGFDSVIEVFAACVVLWQLRGPSETRDRLALRLIGLSFFALAAYITVAAVRDLLAADHPAESIVGIALAVASLIIMPALAVAKRRTGQQLGSVTVVAESSQTLLCAYLSAVLLAGLVLNATLGWWCADPLAGLVIAALALREGREAWNGDTCCD